MYSNYSILKQHPFKINDEPMSGPGVFRFRYGPVTSGVREAGCFHLYTYGEKILRATIDISWKQREMGKAMQQKPPETALLMAEKVCSNFAVSHSIAFSRAVEMSLGISPSLLTKNWRTLLIESERIYNHLHLIYKLASSAAQKVLAAHVSALFEDALRLNENLTGSRYLMGINNIGKLNHTPAMSDIQKVAQGYRELAERFTKLYKHSLANYNYLDRLHSAGTITPVQAEELGLTGPSSRACGIKDNLNDTTEHLISLPVITQNEGDALARMEVRAEEIVNSCQYLVDHLRASDSWYDSGEKETESTKTGGTGYAVVNSPSGALGYYVEVDEGKVRNVGIFTPSYPGMHAVSRVLEGLIFTDFPFVFDSFGVHFADAAC
jgi:Ni,Fe-hydrogenase III large subunit